MKLPRDVGGSDLARAIERYGYKITRQSGSHMRFTTQIGGEHHITIPSHKPLKVGTLSAILDEISRHLKRDKLDLVKELRL